MSDLRGRNADETVSDILTKGTGGNVIEDGTGEPYGGSMAGQDSDDVDITGGHAVLNSLRSNEIIYGNDYRVFSISPGAFGGAFNRKLKVTITGIDSNQSWKSVKLKYRLGDTSSGAATRNLVGEIIFLWRGSGEDPSDRIKVAELGATLDIDFIPTDSATATFEFNTSANPNTNSMVFEILDSNADGLTLSHELIDL